MQFKGRRGSSIVIYEELSDRMRGWQPALDVFETEKAVVVRVEIAGARREDLHVSVDGDVLKISGVRRPPSEEGVEQLHRMEIVFGPFERSIRITVPFERSGVQAHLADGFLRITLPKRAPATRRIEVEP